MADFNQAIKWLKEGKKVRREYWTVESLYCKYSDKVWGGSKMKEGIFFFKDNSENTLKTEFIFLDFEATDWEIYEEDDKLKTLNELEGTSQFNDNPSVKTGAVDVISLRREAIRDIEFFRKNRSSNPDYSKEELNGIERYIMWKNNLTEEDLK